MKRQLIFLTSPPVQMIDKFFGKSLNNQARTNEACRAYAEALMALGKELNIEVINLWTAIQQRDDWSTACLTDGIHFTTEGSKIVDIEGTYSNRLNGNRASTDYRPNRISGGFALYKVGADGKTTGNFSKSISCWQIEWANGIKSNL